MQLLGDVVRVQVVESISSQLLAVVALGLKYLICVHRDLGPGSIAREELLVVVSHNCI